MGAVDPKRDVDVIETELMLADLASLEKQFDKVSGKAKSGDKAAKEQMVVLEALKKGLSDGQARARSGPGPESHPRIRPSNRQAGPVRRQRRRDAGPAVAADFEAFARSRGSESVVICGKLESEIAQLAGEDRADVHEGAGLGARAASSA